MYISKIHIQTSKYMTVHQAKGLEWDKVIVSVTTNRFDKIQITDINPMFPDSLTYSPPLYS